MSLTEYVAVGRKTPGDGKVEVSAAFAAALGGDGARVDVLLQAESLPGRVSVMPCTCAKAGAAGVHQHQFVECTAFRNLPVGSGLTLAIDGGRVIATRSES